MISSDLFSVRTLLAAALAISFCYAVGGAAAENAELEKCTCDTQRENEPNNGAWVKNATACWSTEDRGRQWCDITVQSLEGAGAHSTVVGTLLQYQTDGPALVEVLQDQFQVYATSFAVDDHTISFDVDRAMALVPSLLKENEGRIVACVTAFRDATFGKRGIQEEGESFRCSVGESSGWLRVEFRVGDFWLAYMLAPNG